MKKISLKNLNLQEVKQLSREQLKNVLGGFSGSGSGSGGSGGSGGFVKYVCQTITTGSYECYQNENSPLSCVDTCVEAYGDNCFGCYTVIS